MVASARTRALILGCAVLVALQPLQRNICGCGDGTASPMEFNCCTGHLTTTASPSQSADQLRPAVQECRTCPTRLAKAQPLQPRAERQLPAIADPVCAQPAANPTRWPRAETVAQHLNQCYLGQLGPRSPPSLS